MNHVQGFADDDSAPPVSLAQHAGRPAAHSQLPRATKNPRLRLLLVEDELSDAVLFESLLAEVQGAEFDLVRVSRLAMAIERLEQEMFHIVFLDLGLPDSQGLNTFTSLVERFSDVPVVVLTENDNDELAVRAVQAGAQDYIVKGADAASLVRSLRYAMERHRAQRQLRHALVETQTNEASLRRLIEQRFDGILVLDSQRRIVFANTTAEKMLAVAPGELLGREPEFAVVAGESDLNLLRYDNSTIAVELRVAAIDWQGHPAHLAQLRDLTERQKLDRERAEIEVAREMLRSILPTTPWSVAGLELAGQSLPAENVGGDYFDWFELPEGVGIVIADASGHGLASAILISEAAAYVRAFAASRKQPADLLQAANRQLVRVSPKGSFITLKYVRIDTGSRLLDFAGAGHPDGFVLDSHGNVRHVLRDQNQPLGLALDASFVSSPSFALEPGDRVVLITDGIIESLGLNRTTFGKQRLLETARGLLNRPAQEIATGVCGAAREFAMPLSHSDDLTAVVVKVT